jgi:hypothetical protein
MTPGRLRFDSARVRNSPAVRTLLFEVGDLTVDVMLLERAAGVRVLHGQVVRGSGAAVADATVRVGDTIALTDDHGQFAVTLEQGQAARLLVDTPEGPTIDCAFPREEAASA